MSEQACVFGRFEYFENESDSIANGIEWFWYPVPEQSSELMERMLRRPKSCNSSPRDIALEKEKHLADAHIVQTAIFYVTARDPPCTLRTFVVAFAPNF
jgi:hypothetical protein